MGATMHEPISWSFTTPIAPSVIAETPASSGSDLYNGSVPISSPISATFNEAVQTGSIGFTLTSNTGTLVPVTLSYNSSSLTDTLTPNSALAFGTTYTATVSGLVGTDGVAMSAPYRWSFTTDAAPPTVIVESPASGATGVAVSSTVTAWFNQSVVEYLSMQSSNINVTLTTSSGTSVAASFAYNLITNSVTLTPNAALSYGTT